MPKQRRAIRRQFIIVLAIVLIGIVSVFKIPSFLISRNLGDLGYDKEAQKAIIDKKISKLLIDNDYYSKLLNDEVKKDTFKTDYAELYIFRDSLSDLEFTLYDKLLSKGYEDKEVIELFRNLENYELTPLLVFDKVEIKTYIDDCLAHRDTNSQDNLTLSNDYLHPYEDYQKITDVKADTLVSSKFYLDNYEPEKLVPIGSAYASEGVEIDNMAYESFTKMIDDLSKDGLAAYALEGYRSYTRQEVIYSQNGAAVKAGFSDMQSGLMVTLTDTATNSLDGFNETPEYKWLMENAHKYGFILRYPEGKETITNQEFTPYMFRYVGEETAQKIKESRLTFDEYYMLYLYDYSDKE